MAINGGETPRGVIAKNRRRLTLAIVVAATVFCGTIATPAVADAGKEFDVRIYPGHAANSSKKYNYRGIPHPDTPGEASPLFNPDRGLRHQLSFNASSRTDAAAVEAAVRRLEQKYGTDANVTQLHFNLADYVGSSLHDRVPPGAGWTAIENMQVIFDTLKKLGYTVVLGFSYEEDHPNLCNDPKRNYTLQHIQGHLNDLKEFLQKNAGMIASWEAGFLGAWGEWGPNCQEIQTNPENRRANVNALMRSITEAAPDGVQVMMRYPWYRSWLDDDIKPSIGFHNNYFAAGYWRSEPPCLPTDAPPNPCGGPANQDFYNPYRERYWLGGNEYEFHNYFGEVLAASPAVMLDAEMAWGLLSPSPSCPGRPATEAPYHPNKGLDGIVAAERLQSMHYTTMSETHNVDATFACWHKQDLQASDVAASGLPFDDVYFQDARGRPVSRTAYEYIRDHLGYRLRLNKATFKKNADGKLPVKLEIVNDGFSAPHIPRKAHLVLLNREGLIVSDQALTTDWTKWQGLCSTEFQHNGVWTTRSNSTSCAKPTHTVEGAVDLTALPAGTYSLGLWLPDPHDGLTSDPRYAVRLANSDVDWRAGVNVIARVELRGTSTPRVPAGAPTLSAGSTPNNTGAFTLAWTPAADPDAGGAVTYTLQHKDADDAQFTDVTTGLQGTSFSFPATAPEGEGTWTYRVRATDSRGTPGQYSAAGEQVVVDR